MCPHDLNCSPKLELLDSPTSAIDVSDDVPDVRRWSHNFNFEYWLEQNWACLRTPFFEPDRASDLEGSLT